MYNWVTLLYSSKAMAAHSSTLAWKIPWMEEPGRLQSMEWLRVRHDWGTSLSLFPFMHWRRKWQPTPVFLPGESQGRGAWWAAIYGVAQSRTRLKWLSSSSSSSSSSIWEPNTSFWKIYLSQFNRKVKNNSFKSVRTQGRIIYYIIFPWTFFSVILKCFRKLKWKTGI